MDVVVAAVGEVAQQDRNHHLALFKKRRFSNVDEECQILTFEWHFFPLCTILHVGRHPETCLIMYTTYVWTLRGFLLTEKCPGPYFRCDHTS